MRYVQHLSSKAAAPPQAATAPVATPHFGQRQRLSHSGLHLKLQSIFPKVFPKELYSKLSEVSHIQRASKDAAAAAGPCMPEEWPEFSKKKIHPDIVGRFFNRSQEYNVIMKYLNAIPSKPFLFFGPQDSGKSALLRLIVEQEKSRVLYLNCGLNYVVSPKLMARELCDVVRKLPSGFGEQFEALFVSNLKSLSKLLSGDAEKNGPADEVLPAVLKEYFGKDSTTNLQSVIKLYDLILQSVPPGQKKPIIVIDYIDVLQYWKTEDEVQLDRLLEFFKRVSMEEHLAHVVLAATDYFLVSRLSARGFDDDVRRIEVLGDLMSAEAFVYLCGGKVRNRKGVEEEWPGLMTKSEETLALGMTPEDWKKVWSVCGGKLYILQKCVFYARCYKSWDKAAMQMLSEPRKGVRTASNYPKTIPLPIGSTDPCIWEAKHYKAVIRLIAANPYHAVRTREVHAALEKVGIKSENVSAAQVLLSMVEFNVLAMRPYSQMAKDIPREAFFKEVGDVEEEDIVVTMKSPTHLAVVLEELELEEIEAKIRSAQAAEGKGQAQT